MSSKNFLQKRDFAAGVFIWLRPRTPNLSPLTHCILVRVYSILIHTGKGGKGKSSSREKGRGATVDKPESKNY
jgi:hypothetical protein